jgi:hypothetical protein
MRPQHICYLNENCKLDESSTSIVKIFYKPCGALLYIYIDFIFLITVFNAHTREKQHLSFTYAMYKNALNNIAFHTCISLYTVRRVHPLGSDHKIA